MSLLDKELEASILSDAGKKTRIRFDGSKLDPAMLKAIGKFLGTSSPGSIIKEACLACACFVAQPKKGLAEYVRFDNAQKLFAVIEERNKAEKGRKGSQVSVLRWNLVVLAGPLLDLAGKELKTTEQVINILLQMCNSKIADVFTFRTRE